MTTAVDTSTQPARPSEKDLQRQFVNFMFFKVDRAFRSESAEVKAQAKREFAEAERIQSQGGSRLGTPVDDSSEGVKRR